MTNFEVLLEQSFLQSLVQQSLGGIKTVNVVEAFGLQIVGNISRPSCNINDFRILAHIGKFEEIVNQAIGISISHNFLANFSREIFQILNQTQKCKAYVILQHFVLRECLNVKVLTVGQWSNNLVLYSVLLQDPNKYMMMKFWKFISLPPFSKWSMYPRQILSILRIMAEWTVFCSDILLFGKKWRYVILGNFYKFKLLTSYSKGSDSTEDFRVPKITEEDYCCHTRFFFQDDARLKLWWSFVASSKIPPKNQKKNRNFWDCFFRDTRTPSFRGR